MRNRFGALGQLAARRANWPSGLGWVCGVGAGGDDHDRAGHLGDGVTMVAQSGFEGACQRALMVGGRLLVVVNDQAGRALAVGNALASVHLEGGEIGSEMQAMAERYVAGEITIDQLIEFARAGTVTT